MPTYRTTPQSKLVQALYADGWYAEYEDAEACLAQCVDLGAKPIGLIQSKYDTWGIIYLSSRVIFENHILDDRNALFAVARNPAPA